MPSFLCLLSLCIKPSFLWFVVLVYHALLYSICCPSVSCPPSFCCISVSSPPFFYWLSKCLIPYPPSFDLSSKYIMPLFLWFVVWFVVKVYHALLLISCLSVSTQSDAGHLFVKKIFSLIIYCRFLKKLSSKSKDTKISKISCTVHAQLHVLRFMIKLIHLYVTLKVWVLSMTELQ